MKKIAAVILTAFLIIAFGSLSEINLIASAYESSDGWSYVIDNGEAELIGVIDENKFGEVVIPSTLGGYPVTRIRHGVFENSSKLISVIIPNGVKSIQMEAFAYCRNLKSVTIPSSLKSIGDSAFYGCDKLENVYINDLAAWCNINFADNPLIYAENLYLNGTLVTELVIPNGVTSIRNFAFFCYEKLVKVSIPNSVTSIGESAFSNCKSLMRVTIPNSVTNIEEYAFYGCVRLKEVSIGAGVDSLKSNTFKESRLDNIVINKTLSNMKTDSFVECTIKKVTFNGTRSEWENMPYSKDIIFEEAQIVCSDDKISEGSETETNNKPNTEENKKEPEKEAEKELDIEENNPEDDKNSTIEEIPETKKEITADNKDSKKLKVSYIITAISMVLVLGSVAAVVMLLIKQRAQNLKSIEQTIENIEVKDNLDK